MAQLLSTFSVTSQNREIETKKEKLITTTSKEIYKCKNCEKEITYEQIKSVIGEGEARKKKTFINDCLLYVNKYRKDFGLDTCLRKAHFVAHIGAETAFRATTELTDYNLNSNFRKYFKKQTIDDIIIESLKDNFTNIFKVLDENDKVVSKNNDELAKLVKGVTVETKYLYGTYNLKEKDSSGKKVDKDTLVKEIKEKKKKNGKEVEVAKYKIYITKHSHFGVPLLSRAYANRMGNGNELSRDGYRFRGRGIKQLTGKANYINFGVYRNRLIQAKKGFDGDETGEVDFTKDTNSAELKGNYDKIGDLSNKMYGVQAAVWFFNFGNKAGTSKYTIGWADEDDIFLTSVTINGGTNGLKTRCDYVTKARGDKALKVYEHYRSAYEHGNVSERFTVKDRLRILSKNQNRKWGGKTYIVDKDPEAEKLLNEIIESEKIKPIETMPFIPLVVKKDLTLAPMNFETPTNTKSKKHKRKQQ